MRKKIAENSLNSFHCVHCTECSTRYYHHCNDSEMENLSCRCDIRSRTFTHIHETSNFHINYLAHFIPYKMLKIVFNICFIHYIGWANHLRWFISNIHHMSWNIQPWFIFNLAFQQQQKMWICIKLFTWNCYIKKSERYKNVDSWRSFLRGTIDLISFSRFYASFEFTDWWWKGNRTKRNSYFYSRTKSIDAKCTEQVWHDEAEDDFH